MSRHPSRRRDRGYTLLSVLITMGIGAVIILGIERSIARSITARTKLDASIQRAEAERLKLEKATREARAQPPDS